jgi:hypothetical protein
MGSLSGRFKKSRVSPEGPLTASMKRRLKSYLMLSGFHRHRFETLSIVDFLLLAGYI